MERGEFLSKLGIGMAIVCAGCAISSCGSKGNDPAPSNNNGGNNGGGNTSGTSINLVSELANIGDSKILGDAIVVRLATGNIPASFTAVQVACTHQGTSIGYNLAQGIFICPNHGSEFSTSGAVVLGPATANLKVYTVAINNNVLTVS